MNEKLEEARRGRKIGKSLEACVAISGVRPEEGSESTEVLAELFIVSSVEFTGGNGAETITVTRAEEHDHGKCVRCWRYYPQSEFATDSAHPELCRRCTDAVLALSGPPR